MRRSLARATILVTIYLLFNTFTIESTYCFDNKVTHPDLTKIAIKYSSLNSYLKFTLGVSEGVDKTYNGYVTKYWFVDWPTRKTIMEWMNQGADNEDVPMCRAVSHFHNPLQSWDTSYMNDAPWFVNLWCARWKYYSDITWATGYTARDGILTTPEKQQMGWDNARNYFYTALTSGVNDDRERYFSKSFSAIGHVLHLLQDVAVPAHTRNDFQSHLKFNGITINSLVNPLAALNYPIKIGNPFEYYVSTHNGLISNITVDNVTIFANPMLTDFWDTDQKSDALGLTEFTNANFFSDETIPNNDPIDKHIFPSPLINIDSKTQFICTDSLPGASTPRKYVSRGRCPVQPGGNVDHFATISLINSEAETSVINPRIKEVWLDDNVHNTYAKQLLPEAVRYSAALINYFFRGTLEISPPAQHVYAIIDGSKSPQLFTKLTAEVKNTTPNDAFKGSIIIQAVARFKVIKNYFEDLSSYPPVGAVMNSIPYTYSVSDPITLAPDPVTGKSLESPTELTFKFNALPIPAGITDLTLQVVAKGTLGNEKDIAVAVGMRDLSEPTHHVIWNLSDMFGLDYNLYTANYSPYTSTYIKNDKTLADKVDLNHNGIFNETGEPFIEPHEITFEISYGPDSKTIADAPLVAGGPLQAGKHFRLIGIFDLSLPNYIELGWYDFESSGVYVSLIQPAVTQGEGTAWQATPAISFRNWLDGATKRPFIQHYKMGVIRCKPVSYHNDNSTYCVYPEEQSIPAEKMPWRAVIE